MQEARIAAGPGMIVICSRSDPQQLRALLATLDPSTIRGVISFGVAGGLDPSLKSGDVVVATEVLAGDARWLAASRAERADDRQRRARSAAAIVRGGLAGVEQVVAARAGKAALQSETGAAAVDMESHIAAAYAAEAGLPFAALRVISDPAHRALPALAKAAIKPNGDIDLRKVLRGVARNPRTLRALVSTGIDFNRALRSLRGCRGFLLGTEGLVAGEHLNKPLSGFGRRKRPDRQQRSGLFLVRFLEVGVPARFRRPWKPSAPPSPAAASASSRRISDSFFCTCVGEDVLRRPLLLDDRSRAPSGPWS